MLFQTTENRKAAPPPSRNRVLMTGTQISEKETTRGSTLQKGLEAARFFPLTRDMGQSAPIEAGKPDVQRFLFEPQGGQPAINHSMVKQDAAAPGAYQKGDSEYLLQVDKMTWAPAGPPEMVVSEKGDVMETSRLPMPSREIRSLADMIEKTVWRQENGQSQARIQLKPAFMGHLHLNVTTDQLKVTVEIRAETLMARDFLETHLNVLKTELQESGLEVDKIDVLVDPDLNNKQEQGRTAAHKQMHRGNGHSNGMKTQTNEETAESKTMILSDSQENRVNCFV